MGIKYILEDETFEPDTLMLVTIDIVDASYYDHEDGMQYEDEFIIVDKIKLIKERFVNEDN